jgi:hypothetical protein
MDKYLYYTDDPDMWKKPTKDWRLVSDFTASIAAGTEVDNLTTNRHYWFDNELCELTYKYVTEKEEQEIEIKTSTSELIPAYTHRTYSIANAPAISGYTI